MIGNPKWFKYRIFGWGISPKTWQGWVYVAAIALVIGFTMSISMTGAIKMWVFGIVMAIILADIIHIMINMQKMQDERENLHQLIIERNCSFAAIAAMLIIAIYQTAMNRSALVAGTITGIPFDYSILILIIVMTIVKVASTFYVKSKM